MSWHLFREMQGVAIFATLRDPAANAGSRCPVSLVAYQTNAYKISVAAILSK
ncbi:MAG: hypothetical protein WCP96_05760 [Methylococcaceae bacterium]